MVWYRVGERKDKYLAKEGRQIVCKKRTRNCVIWLEESNRCPDHKVSRRWAWSEGVIVEKLLVHDQGNIPVSEHEGVNALFVG